jgi:membrane-bound ClpP family serine protease
MENTILIKAALIFVVCFLSFVICLFTLFRHRAKAQKKELDLIGKTAIVQTELSPKGAIITNDELWLAQSCNEVKIPIGSKVKIVGVKGHLLEVAPIVIWN